MKKLVTVADDFGFTTEVNRGCLESLQKGFLKEVSLMLNSTGSDNAVKIINDHKLETVGIHITLNNMNATGKYLRTEDYLELLDAENEEQLEKRVMDELKQFEDTLGRPPSHINSHHSLHQNNKLIHVIGSYAGEHGLYVRKATHFSDGNNIAAANPQETDKAYMQLGAKVTDYIFEQIAGDYHQAYHGFMKNLTSVKEDTTTEIFFHPGYVDDTLKKYSSLTERRERDIKLLQDKNFMEELDMKGFQLVTFAELG